MPSIKDKLFQKVRPFFSNQLDMMLIKDRIANEKDRQQRVHISEVSELDMFVGKPVICISNEWETPIIGLATRIDFISQAQNPVLCVLNYLDVKEYLVLGKTFFFTTQRFDALFKLSPFELCSFIYGRYLQEDFDKEKSGELLTKEKVVNLLDVNGFYEQFGIPKPTF